MKIKFLGTTLRAEMAHPRLSVNSLTPPPRVKMISGTDLTQTVKMNELFSPAGLASQVLCREQGFAVIQ